MSKYKYQSGFSPYFEGFVKAKEIVNLGTIQYTKVFDEFDRFTYLHIVLLLFVFDAKFLNDTMLTSVKRK